MGLNDAKGTIKTRSGTWDWRVKELRSWPKSDVTGKRLGFEDPSNTVNRMSLELDPELEELSDTLVGRLSLTPLKRRFEDADGGVWIARPVEPEESYAADMAGRVSLHNLVRGSKIVDLPPDRTLGDLSNEELLALV